MILPQQIKNHLLHDVKEMASHPELFAKNPGRDFSRPKKLTPEDMLLFPILMNQDSTGSELLSFFDHDLSRAPSTSAYFQQRDKIRPDTFRILLNKFNSHFSPTLFDNKFVLTAVDGTGMSMFYNPGDPLTYFKPNKASPNGHNELHATAALRLSDAMFSDMVVQPAPKLDERAAFCQMIDRDQPIHGIPLYLADRGFPSYNVFAHCFEKGAFFLIRSKDLYVESLLRNDMPSVSSGEFDTEVERIIVRHNAKQSFHHPEYPDRYRFVDKNTSFDFIDYGSRDEYQMRLRVVRVLVDKSNYEYLITNLPADDFPIDKLRLLYWMRWKVEVSIMHLKKVIGAEAFHSRSLSNVTHELYARLIKYNFCSAIASIAVKNLNGKKGPKYQHQVNFSMAIKKCHVFLCQKALDPPIDIVAIIEKNTLPVRSGRKFTRNKSYQKPMTFLYRH